MLAGLLIAAATGSGITQSGLVVRSSSEPHLAFRISDGFTSLPPLEIALPSSDVDRRIFVDADTSGSIRRLVVLQFERVRPGSDFKFVYAPKPPYDFAGVTYRIGTYVYDDAAEAAAAPGFESALTRKTLLAHGYDPPRLLRVMRLARVTDPGGQREVIIFYEENADAQYPDGLKGKATDADGDLPLTGADAKALIDRARSAIAVSPA